MRVNRVLKHVCIKMHTLNYCNLDSRGVFCDIVETFFTSETLL